MAYNAKKAVGRIRVGEQPGARRCSICDSPRATLINAFLAAGRAPYWIDAELRRMGAKPSKDETIRKHRDTCLGGNITNPDLLSSSLTKRVDPNADFAMAVRKEANRLLAAGELAINANHGLSAQMLLDRRAEKVADRQVAVEIAALLSGTRGGETMQIGPPEELIVVGEWADVTDMSTVSAEVPRLAESVASGEAKPE